MDKQLYKRVKDYRIALAVVREMLTAGVITENDYGIICTVLAEKYGLKSSTIFSEIDLIYGKSDANM